MTPDWSAAPEAVPYANLENPQSLNLYSYVLNNPVTGTDADGHLSDLIFDGATNTITLVDKNGRVVGKWAAYDNVDSSATLGKLTDGTYRFLDTKAPHLHGGTADTPSGEFGPDGIFRLQEFRGADGQEHTGVGVHAGREGDPDLRGREGPEHATMGCVRTCSAATGTIRELVKTDPLETLRVINNRKQKMCKGGAPCASPSPEATQPAGATPPASSGAGGGGGPLLLDVSYREGRQARPRPRSQIENRLSGVTVGKSPIAEVIKVLGKPQKFMEVTSPDDPSGSGERIYTWLEGRVTFQVKTEFYTDRLGRLVESTVHAAEAWGREPSAQFGRTGRGLALGSDVSVAKRIYGEECSCGRYEHGAGDQGKEGQQYSYYLSYPRQNYEQERGSLSLDADAQGRIVHILVVGPS
jgi:hypothetical protein